MSSVQDILTPRLDCKYGAPMGRPTLSCYWDKAGERVELEVIPNARPFHLVRVPLNSGGYDKGGAYWGFPNDLWGFIGPIDDVRGFVRAKTRQEAKEHVLDLHPHARFFR
jgi:hypothetical protein